MVRKTWKSAESEIAKFYNSRRRGADTSINNTGYVFGDVLQKGKSDIIYPNASIEVKHGKSISYGLLRNALEQAVRNKTEPSEIAVAHIHRTNMRYADCWTGLFINDFDRLVANPKFSIKNILYTMILPKKGRYYNKSIETAMDYADAHIGDGAISMAMFYTDPVIVVQRLGKFHTWFLDGFDSFL